MRLRTPLGRPVQGMSDHGQWFGDRVQTLLPVVVGAALLGIVVLVIYLIEVLSVITVH